MSFISSILRGTKERPDKFVVQTVNTTEKTEYSYDYIQNRMMPTPYDGVVEKVSIKKSLKQKF